MEREQDKLNHPEYYPPVMMAGEHTLVQQLFCHHINHNTGYRAIDLNSKLTGDYLSYIKKAEKPAAVFIYYEIENCRGADLARSIKAYHIDTGIIGLSYRCSEIKIMRMLDAGARAFLNYDCPQEDIEKALDCVLAGCYYFNGCLTRALYEQWLIMRPLPDAPYKNKFDKEHSHIINLIHQGKKHDEIAKAMETTKKSVDNSVCYLLAKTNSRNSHELVNYAIRNEEI